MTDRIDIVERLRDWPNRSQADCFDDAIEAASTIEDLRAALEPFVAHLSAVEQRYDAEYVRFLADHVLLTNDITWGQFRAARAALSKSKGGT